VSYIHHQYWPLSPTVPKNTPIASPQSTAFNIVQGVLHGVMIQIPAGHAGVTGCKITYNGQQIIPWSNNAWLVGAGDTFNMQWGQEIMATGLEFVAYNTDVTSHQFFIWADVEPILGTPPAEVGTSAELAYPSTGLIATISGLSG
jgi:hypothetical protein